MKPAQAFLPVLCLALAARGGVAQEGQDPWFQEPRDAASLLRWSELPPREDWEAVAWSAWVHLRAWDREAAAADVARMLELDPGNPDALRYRLQLALLDGGPEALQQAIREARAWLEDHPEMPAAHRQEVERNRRWAERELLRRLAVAGARGRARLAPLPGLAWLFFLAWLLGKGGGGSSGRGTR